MGLHQLAGFSRLDAFDWSLPVGVSGGETPSVGKGTLVSDWVFKQKSGASRAAVWDSQAVWAAEALR
ncbi:MAG: hypothetical protein NDI61_08570 [Bdellovibrionaceae bacterium]|nr:hypothetical protein [Pseudobdellovibrionaceae bacterium]